MRHIMLSNNRMLAVTCETTACDAHKACAACCHSWGITVDADGPTSPPPCPEVRDIKSAGSIGSKAGACDVQDIEACSINGTPTLAQSRVRGRTCHK